MESGTARVISVVLSEQDWQAFTRVHLQPVAWLHEKIQESIAPGAMASSGRSIPAPGAGSTTSVTTR